MTNRFQCRTVIRLLNKTARLYHDRSANPLSEKCVRMSHERTVSKFHHKIANRFKRNGFAVKGAI